MKLIDYTEKVLTPWAQEDRDRFNCVYRNYHECTCHLSHPPCGWCTHEGNPLNQQEPEFYETTFMNLNRAHFTELFRTDFYTVGVKFFTNANALAARSENKTYTYKVPKDIKLDIGAKVFVCTSNNLEDVQELKVAIVFNVNKEPEIDEGGGFTYKWIVGTYDDVLAGYRVQVEKDTRLKRAVAMLEKKLAQVSLKKQIEMAMNELGDDDRKELSELFGMPSLLGTDEKA